MIYCADIAVEIVLIMVRLTLRSERINILTSPTLTKVKPGDPVNNKRWIWNNFLKEQKKIFWVIIIISLLVVVLLMGLLQQQLQRNINNHLAKINSWYFIQFCLCFP